MENFNITHLVTLLLLNVPAYVCAGLALSRKMRDEDYYSVGVFIVLLALLLLDAILLSQVCYPDTATEEIIRIQSGVSVLLVPVIFMFLAPQSGQERFNRTNIMLFLETLLMLMPEMAWELVPGYALTQYVEPQDIMGISIFYQGEFLYHLYWPAIILILQSFTALTQMKKLYNAVKTHGANYSWKAKASYYWNFSCGYFLSLSFLFPFSMWQTPEMRWTYYILADIVISIGCLLVYMGFDLNPIVIHQTKKLSLGDFMLETGDVVGDMRHMLEEDRVYLEKGLQSDTIAQRLNISHSYFLRMMQAVYNCSFPEWINNARIEYSKGLLRENKYSLERIANMCGYSSSKAYVRLFKRITGQTPAEWCHQDDYIATDDSLFDAKEAIYDDD